MTFIVRLTRAAGYDLVRLAEFLEEKSSMVAGRFRATLRTAVESLSEMPDRAPRVADTDFRDLVVPFGSAGYAVRYKIEGSTVVIVRIFHTREDR